MAKYRIVVPPPKAKRMEGSGKLIITYSHGWEGETRKILHLVNADVEWAEKKDTIGIKAGIVTFEVEDHYEWIYSTSCLDGDTFDILVEYTNSTKTRKQIIRPVPERIK